MRGVTEMLDSDTRQEGILSRTESSYLNAAATRPFDSSAAFFSSTFVLRESGESFLFAFIFSWVCFRRATSRRTRASTRVGSCTASDVNTRIRFPSLTEGVSVNDDKIPPKRLPYLSVDLEAVNPFECDPFYPATPPASVASSSFFAPVIF
jgi:hypothetical protein